MSASLRLLSIAVIPFSLFSGCGSSEEASQPESENVSTGTMQEFEKAFPDTPERKLVSPKELKADPAERDKWAKIVKTSLTSGNKEGVQDYLARIRNHFGARSAFEAFVEAGIYEADDPLRIWAVGMIDGLMVEQGEEAALVVADALLQFARDPVQRVHDSALNELQSLARNKPQVISHSLPSMRELLSHENPKYRTGAISTFGTFAGVKDFQYSDFSGAIHPLASPPTLDLLKSCVDDQKLRDRASWALAEIAKHHLQTGIKLLDWSIPRLADESEDVQIATLHLINALVNSVESTRSHHLYHKSPPAEATERLTKFRNQLKNATPLVEACSKSENNSVQSASRFPLLTINTFLKKPITR